MAYGVDDICAVDNMVWTSCVYAVGDIGYAVGICCGEHLLVLYGVENHMVWRTVVHTIYDLLSTLYIWCGHMVWVHTSFTDDQLRLNTKSPISIETMDSP